MTQFTIVRKSAMWSVERLTKEVEQLLAQKKQEGYDIVSVSFGLNIWWVPTAFVTLKREA